MTKPQTTPNPSNVTGLESKTRKNILFYESAVLAAFIVMGIFIFCVAEFNL